MRLSTAWGRFVLVSVLACLPVTAPVLAREPGARGWQRVREDWGKAYKEKDWPRAIELGLKLVQLLPDDSTHQYNLACVYSLNGNVESAAEWLGKAAENGFSQARLFETDSDLNSVREHAAYRAALAVMKENLKRAHAELKKRFLRHPPHVFLPPGHDEEKASPLIIALHGYGAQAEGIAEQWLTVAAEAGAILVTPQAVHPVPGTSGFSWMDVSVNNADEADFLVQLTLELVMEEFEIDERRIVLTGFSQGAFIAYALGARQPYRFSGVIPMGGGYIPAIDAPAKATGERSPRFYFMVGERDRPVAQNRRAVKDFAAAGFDVKLRVYPGVGHTFPRDRDEELRKALEFVLKP